MEVFMEILAVSLAFVFFILGFLLVRRYMGFPFHGNVDDLGTDGNSAEQPKAEPEAPRKKKTSEKKPKRPKKKKK